MFIFSLRASSIRFFAVLLLVAVLFFGIALSAETVFASSSNTEISFTGIKTEENRIAFISNFGFTVDPSSVEKMDFVMPENFDRVMLGYNEIQKTQGLDLSKYAKKKVTRYTYSVTNYKTDEGEIYDGEVFVNLLVYRNRIVGCDISSADPEGFVKPLVKSV